MKKYELIGITEYANKHLNVKDCEYLTSMIGVEVSESEVRADIDGGKMMDMPDGEMTHIVFLNLKPLNHE